MDDDIKALLTELKMDHLVQELEHREVVPEPKIIQEEGRLFSGMKKSQEAKASFRFFKVVVGCLLISGVFYGVKQSGFLQEEQKPVPSQLAEKASPKSTASAIALSDEKPVKHEGDRQTELKAISKEISDLLARHAVEPVPTFSGDLLVLVLKLQAIDEKYRATAVTVQK